MPVARVTGGNKGQYNFPWGEKRKKGTQARLGLTILNTTEPKKNRSGSHIYLVLGFGLCLNSIIAWEERIWHSLTSVTGRAQKMRLAFFQQRKGYKLHFQGEPDLHISLKARAGLSEIRNSCYYNVFSFTPELSFFYRVNVICCNLSISQWGPF